MESAEDFTQGSGWSDIPRDDALLTGIEGESASSVGLLKKLRTRSQRSGSPRGVVLRTAVRKRRASLPAPRNWEEDVNRALQKEGLYRSRIKESLAAEDAALTLETPEGGLSFPDARELLGQVEDQADLATRITRNPELLIHLSRRLMRGRSIPSCLSAFGASPRDLKNSRLLELLLEGKFEKEPRLRAVAFLVLRGMTTEEDVQAIAPEVAPKEFHRLQAKVHQIIEKELPPFFREILSFLKSLPVRQRQALEKVYFENDEGLPQKEIARKIGISRDALKERLEKAKEKLKTHFAPWIPQEDRRPAYWKTLFKTPDTQLDGFYVRSHAKPTPAYKIDPMTGARIGRVKERSSAARTPQPGFPEWKAKQRLASYWPRHDGVFSPLLAHLPNLSDHPGSKKLQPPDRPETKKILTSDPKNAFDQLDVDHPLSRSRRERLDLRDRDLLNRTVICERGADDLDGFEGDYWSE